MADETDGSWQPTRRDYQDALGGLGVVGFVAAMSSSAGGWDSPGAPDIARGRCERFNATEPRFGAVCMRGGTELPRSGKYDAKDTGDGTYRCACCGSALFGSESKFDSGTGWPSFSSPFEVDSVRYAKDALIHVEVRCHRCDAHLGHVFGDGPKPTGLRYCMNSVCLTLDSSTPSRVAPTGDLPWVCHWALMTALAILACFGLVRLLWRGANAYLVAQNKRRAKTSTAPLRELVPQPPD